jgi:group I intron endonuclease
MFTYIATNTSNGKFYIGSSRNFEGRKAAHLESRDPYPFQRALRKNPEAFKWRVWEDDFEDPIMEQALLDMWFGTEQCYNLNPKADRPPSQKGVPKTVEHKQKIGESLKGKKRSPEHCLNISKAKKGVNPFPNGIPKEVIDKRAKVRVKNGKKWSEEQRRNAGEKRKLPKEEVERRIHLIEESGLDLNQYGAISKVARLLGLTPPSAGSFLKKHYFKSNDTENNTPEG